MTRQLLRARRIIAGGVVDHGSVLITDGTIEAVGRSVDIGEPSDADIVDLGETCVLPGLIDVHNHMTFSGDGRVVQQVVAHDTDAMLAQGRVTAAAMLAAGVTTVRDLGGLGDTVFRLAREVADGQTAGPQIMPSTAQLTAARGPNFMLGGGCADLAAALDRIDTDAAQGAGLVKIIATGSVTDTGSDPTQPVFDDATVTGIVEHAHRRGMLVAAHAHGSAGVTQAARCGVDTIEHASFLTRVITSDSGSGASAAAETRLTSWPDSDTLDILERHRPWIVPTLAAAYAHTQVDRATPESLRDLAHRMTIGRLLLERGLRLVTGTDGGSPGCPNLSLVAEIEQFHNLGMPALDAIAAATAQAAACVGLTDRGLLRAGLRADLIAVPGDPRHQLDALRAPTLVMIGGRIAHHRSERAE